jgi:hypothetical protein
MKPWFIIVIIGAVSGIIVLRTAYSDDDTTTRKPHAALDGNSTEH